MTTPIPRAIGPAFAAFVIGLASCDSPSPSPPEASAAERAEIAADTPILPVNPGDKWTYEVHLEIPEGITSPGAAAVTTRHGRVRTYLGKLSAATGLPETDCFEVEVPGSPREREFVEILPDRILMRGTVIMREETTRPMWLDPAVPFVIAGMKPGTSLPPLSTAGGALTRKTQVIAREEVTVPAGTFPCIRILVTGTDGELELRRTIWFSPGTGIVREEKTRYRGENVVFRETQELVHLARS